jgi:hypothetical protein
MSASRLGRDYKYGVIANIGWYGNARCIPNDTRSVPHRMQLQGRDHLPVAVSGFFISGSYSTWVKSTPW